MTTWVCLGTKYYETLTSWRWVPLVKPAVANPFEKSAAFYGTGSHTNPPSSCLDINVFIPSLSSHLYNRAVLILGYLLYHQTASTFIAKVFIKVEKHYIINSVASIFERTIQTERPPLVGDVSANLCGKSVPRGQSDGSQHRCSRFSRPDPLFFLSSSSSIVLTRLSGPRSRPTASQKLW
jgi:hypothetical protein